MERHSGRAGRSSGQDDGSAARLAPTPRRTSEGSPAVPPDDCSLPPGGWEATSIVAEQLDTIQQRLFALALALGLAASNSTDETTATELRRLEDLVADLIMDTRAWARQLIATGPDGVGAADGDPQGRRDVNRRATSEAAHGRDRRRS